MSAALLPVEAPVHGGSSMWVLAGPPQVDRAQGSVASFRVGRSPEPLGVLETLPFLFFPGMRAMGAQDLILTQCLYL